MENKAEKKSKWKVVASYVIMVLAILYDASLVDILPDVVPVAGWIDDFFVTAIAFFNLLQQTTSDSGRKFSSVMKWIKFGLIAVGVLVVLLLVLFGAVLVKSLG